MRTIEHLSDIQKLGIVYSILSDDVNEKTGLASSDIHGPTRTITIDGDEHDNIDEIRDILWHVREGLSDENGNFIIDESKRNSGVISYKTETDETPKYLADGSLEEHGHVVFTIDVDDDHPLVRKYLSNATNKTPWLVVEEIGYDAAWELIRLVKDIYQFDNYPKWFWELTSGEFLDEESLGYKLRWLWDKYKSNVSFRNKFLAAFTPVD